MLTLLAQNFSTYSVCSRSPSACEQYGGSLGVYMTSTSLRAEGEQTCKRRGSAPPCNLRRGVGLLSDNAHAIDVPAEGSHFLDGERAVQDAHVLVNAHI